MDPRASLDTEEGRKISTPPTPGFESGPSSPQLSAMFEKFFDVVTDKLHNSHKDKKIISFLIPTICFARDALEQEVHKEKHKIYT